MVIDLQKASLWKRMSAGLFDLIMMVMLAVGMAALLSWACGYNTHSTALNDAYSRYEAQYGVKFEMTQEEFDGQTPEQKEQYEIAYAALIADKEVLYLYNLVLNLSLLIITFSILIAVLLLEFAVPMLLKNGQTLGKKIFGVALMGLDGVKIKPMQLFIRTILGKFTIEIMIPAYIVIMIIFDQVGIIAMAILGGILIGQILSMVLSRTNGLIHDAIAGTVPVDMASQMIFDSVDSKIEYIKCLHAEQAARQEY